ncbi:autophagy- protein 2, partial [Coemansia biformis]
MWPSGWSFSLPSWADSNSLQKRLVKFLLRRTVGQFLKTELDDENLDVQLSGGQALNDAVSGLPVVVDSGSIGLISVSVPWTQLWTGHCEIQIDELTVKSRLIDGGAGSDGPDSSDAASGYGERGRPRVGRPGMAESIAMTEGAASILASSVFIADDFLRAEMLGYGEKDEISISRDVERLIANVYEEREQQHRLRRQSTGRPPRGGSGRTESPARRGRPLSPREKAVGSDDEPADPADALPIPGEPGSGVQGLQVMSEMVDRIISAVNIRVQKITIECAVAVCDNGPSQMAGTLRLSVDSLELLDRKSGKSKPAQGPPAARRGSSRNSTAASEDVSPGLAIGGSRDHPAGIEYKVVEFRTLHKLLEIKGLR